jgi:hypothetical protein
VKGEIMAQTSTPTGFERRATAAWRSIRRYLPKPVANAIRKPAKGALRALGLIHTA